MNHRCLLVPTALALLLAALPACRTAPLPPPPPPEPAPDFPSGDDAPPPADASPAASPRNLFVLRWNPDISSFTEDRFFETLEDLDVDGYVHSNWSVHDWAAAAPDDWALFARVGGQDPADDGIAGFFRLPAPPYEAPSWRGDGTVSHYVDTDIFLLNDPASTGLFAASELEPLFPSVDWHGGHSGVLLDPATAARLALCLADRLVDVDPAEHDPDTFSAPCLDPELGEFFVCQFLSDLCPGLRPSFEAPAVPTLLRIAPDWSDPFDPADTRPATFHAPSGDVQVPFMARQGEILQKPLPLPGWTALQLPLSGGALEILLLLPPPSATPGEIASALPDLLSAEPSLPAQPVQARLSIPKLAILPSKAASDFLRNTRLDLDEGSPRPLPAPPVTADTSITLDHPFVLVLRDAQTATPLLRAAVLTP